LQASNPVSSDTLTRTQYISTFNGAQANFVGAPTIGLYPLTVTFTNTSLYADQFVWDYGDGITSTTTSITHTHDYLSAGSYTVSLKVTNAFNSNTLTRPNYIATSGPVIAWFDASPTSGTAPLLVNFNNKSVNAASYTWIFGDGTINIGSFSPYHYYWAGGSYTVTLSVSNAILSDSVTRPAYITVGNLKHYLFFPLIKR
jgi:PKD repeat protein